jgi:hypothetical protein
MPRTGSIAAVKRIPAGLIAAVSVIALGALTSACNVSPEAASVNGEAISVSTLNTQMRDLENTAAGQCVLELQNTASGEGGGGSGTYPTSFAGTVLSDSVGYLVAAQFAAAHGIHLSGADLSTAQNDFTATVGGEITSLVQQATAAGEVSHCQTASGSPYTGAELLAAMPADLRNDEVTNQAVDDRLLARGADLSDAAVLGYYAANQAQFTMDCVSVIATDTQAEANSIVAKLQDGASFSQLATADSVDAQSASNGGQLGCDFPESSVLQSLQLTSVTVGQPVTPLQASNGSWEIYEVTSRTVVPVTSSVSVIRQELLHATVNVQRVSSQLVAFARHSSISVSPQYGTWSGIRIAPPPSPPTQFLLPSYASSGGSSGASSGALPGGVTPDTGTAAG